MKVLTKIKKGFKKLIKETKSKTKSAFKSTKKFSKKCANSVSNFFKDISKKLTSKKIKFNFFKKINLNFFKKINFKWLKLDKINIFKSSKFKKVVKFIKEKSIKLGKGTKHFFSMIGLGISKRYRKIFPKKIKKGRQASLNEDNLFLYTFSFIILTLVLCFLNPFNTNTSSLALSNQVDTENMPNGIEKAKIEVENRIIRSFPFYDDILKGYFGVTLLMNENKYKNANDDELILINTKKNIYTNKDKTRFIIRYDLDEKEEKKQIDSRIKTFNEIYDKLAKQNVNLLIYTVNGIWTSEAILNFDVDEKEPLKYVHMFEEGINENIKFDYLKIIDFTTFKKYFFKTDHHWTMMGAYQGYKDIAKMFDIDEKELVPPNIYKVDDIKFIGSNARACAYDKVLDEIYDIEFDKEYKIKLNGKEIEVEDFTDKKKYLSGDFDKEEFYNHYGKYFRSDTGEVIYTYDENKDKKNVLIMADSFSNCIEHVIASHFYNTHVIDIRYYEYYMKKPFNLYEYVKDNNISDVLFFYSANCIYFDSMDFKME